MSDQIEHNLSIHDRVANVFKAVRWRICTPLIIGLISTSAITAATAAELVIISSSGSDFKVGQVVDSTNDVKLANDATLTLISQSGKVITLKGPHSGPLKVENTTGDKGSLIPSLKKIISGEKTEAGSLGVMRSASVGGAAVPKDPWAIIASRSGRYCVSMSRSVVLWRANSQKTSSLVLLNTANDKEVKTVWHSGQHTLHWPRLLPLVNGATYRVDISGESKLPKLSIQLVPDLPTSAHAAVWMAENGCRKQALRLIGSIK